MLSNDDIKQLFMYCGNDNPEGVYAEVDVLEFARIIEAFVLAQKDPLQEGAKTRW